MPRIFDNIDQALLPALCETLPLADRGDFCVGYFNLRGWKQIDPYIERWSGGERHCCRLLIGMQRLPQDDLRAAFSLTSTPNGIDNQAALRLKKKLAQDFREQLTIGAPTNQDEAGLRRLATQIRAKKVLVKLFLRHPLHAKLYLLFRPDPISPTVGYLGSSNLTFAGLSQQGELNFAVAGVGNVHRLQEDITHLASTNMEPTLRPQFVVDEIDGETVVAVEVAEVPATQKPCFYKQAGLPSGAYLRVGNTNRQMTEYEVSGYLSSRGQPTHDEDPVADATLDDLNSELLDEYVAQLRRARPRASFLEGSREEVLGRENLEEKHSTRNARLMRMMEDMHIVENRGSGVKAMLQAMREANLEPPRFTDRRASFRVTFLNHTLMNPDAIAWLNQFATRALNDHQRLALLYLRQHGEIHNGIYRRLNRVDAMTAGQELHRLVEADLVAQQDVGRWTSYRLKAPVELPEQRVPQSEEEKILAYVRQHGSITNTECRALLDVSLQRSSYLLKKMAAEGLLTREGERRWARYRLP